MTDGEIYRMRLEYSIDMTCERIRERELMKVLEENRRQKEESESLNTRNRE